MKKSSRLGFSWDQEYKPFVELVRGDLKGYGERGGEPSSTEFFLLCLAVGFQAGVMRELPPRKTDGPRLEYITADQLSLIKAVGLSESDSSDSLLDEDAIFDFAERYAAGGLMLLSKARESEANFRDWLRVQLIDYSKISR